MPRPHQVGGRRQQGLAGGGMRRKACVVTVDERQKGVSSAQLHRPAASATSEVSACRGSQLRASFPPRFLDRRVLPGVNKLTWASPKHQTDFYHKDALRCCKAVAADATELQAASAAVASTCALLREALLVRVERKRLYDLPDWEARQATHQVRAVVGRGGQLPTLEGSEYNPWGPLWVELRGAGTSQAARL